MTALSLAALLLLCLPAGYWLTLAIASVRRSAAALPAPLSHRFTVCVAAHDEEAVIGRTVKGLLEMDYPPELVTVHVVADHCSDQTAAVARDAGAIVHVRSDGQRTGKGAALSWLLDRIDGSDAIVVFDADTRVDPRFLPSVEARLHAGESVVQGRHMIANADRGWLATLTSALFRIDNRFQNQGRVNLGLSAKNMGDSICFRTRVLREVGWSDVLTEDIEIRHRLLLSGIRIAYEPEAVGAGDAPPSVGAARTQRARWLRGSRHANRKHFGTLAREGIARRDAALLDAACQAMLPGYSTVAVLAVAILASHLVALRAFDAGIAPVATLAWTVITVALVLYPFLGLALERAPLREHVALVLGPLFILWRSWLAVQSRLRRDPERWQRTPRDVGR